MFRDFYLVSHYQISTYYNKMDTFIKLILYPSVGTVTDPVWRILLAVSVSQFGLSVCLNQVRHHPSSRSRKISTFPDSSGLAKAPQIVSLSVQLHLKLLKGSGVFVSEKTADKIQYIQLIGIKFFAASFTSKLTLNKHLWRSRNKLMHVPPDSTVGTVTRVMAGQPENCALNNGRR